MNFSKYIGYFCAGLFTVAVFNIPCQAFQSKAWYVSLSGSDANGGTKTKPLQSLSKVNDLSLKAGDTVFFKSGETFTGTLRLGQNIYGTIKHPIVITTYGRGRAVIDAKDSSAVSIYKGSYIKLQRLALKGSGRKTGNVKDGFSVVNSNNIWLNDLDISGFQKSGLSIFSSQNAIAKKVFAHNNGSAGITVEGPYQKRESNHIQILYCRAENNPGDPTNLHNHSGNGIIVGNCKNVLIDHCTATNNGWDMPRIGNGPVGIWAYEADSVIIQYCLAYRNKTSVGGGDGGGFDFDGGVTYSIIQYCLSYENQGGGYCLFQYAGASPWHHNIFRYNIGENDGTLENSRAGLFVWNNSDDAGQFRDSEVYGNVIYNDKAVAISYLKQSDSKGLKFYNNIFVAKDTLIRGTDRLGDVKYNDNNWWSLQGKLNIDGKHGKLSGSKIKPDFKKPGKANITSASQLKTFTNYQLPTNSELRKKAAYKGGYGVKNILFK